MGLLKDLKDCEGCARRREQMLETMHRFLAWTQNPKTEPSPFRQNFPVAQTSGPRPRPRPSAGLTPTTPTGKEEVKPPVPNE